MGKEKFVGTDGDNPDHDLFAEFIGSDRTTRPTGDRASAESDDSNESDE